MKLTRMLIWGAVGGLFFGLAMIAVASNLFGTGPTYESVSYLTRVWALVHWPVFSILDRMPHSYDMRGFYQAAAVMVGYWISIGLAAALLGWLVHTWRMKKPRVHVA